MTSHPVSLTSEWYIAPGSETAALAALQHLAEDVHANEPDTLVYLVHTPFAADAALQSLPPVNPLLVVFFETYRSPQAFLDHVNGPIFNNFVSKHGALFVNSAGKPFTTVGFLTQVAGFRRS